MTEISFPKSFKKFRGIIQALDKALEKTERGDLNGAIKHISKLCCYVTYHYSGPGGREAISNIISPLQDFEPGEENALPEQDAMSGAEQHKISASVRR